MCALCDELDRIWQDTGGMETATHAEDLVIARFLSEGMPEDMDYKTRAAIRRDFPNGLDTESEIFRHFMTMNLPPDDDDLVKIARLTVPGDVASGISQGLTPPATPHRSPHILPQSS